MDSLPSASLPTVAILPTECEREASPHCTSASLPLRLVHTPLTRGAAWAALSITGHRHTLFLTDPGERHSAEKFHHRKRNKERREEELWFYILHLRIHPSVLMDFSDYSYCRCWIANFHRNSRYFPWRGAFGALRCVWVDPLSSHVKSLSGTMCRACTRVKFSPMKRRCPRQPRPPCCHPGTAVLTVIGECVLCSSLLPPSLVSCAPLLSGPSTCCPWLLMQSSAHH